MTSRRCISVAWRMRAGLLVTVGVGLAATSPPATAAGGPPLGAARTFAALAGSTLANTGPSAIVGDVGVSPGTAITGFPPGTVTQGAIHAGDATAAQAHSDAALAYAFLKGMPSLPANNLTDTDLGGLTLATGVYKFNTSAQLTGTLTLDAGGDSGALFVIQIGSTLTTASGAAVIVINGGADYDESNVFWQVGSSATLGSGTAFTGNILASASITIVAGSSMTGNALALDGAVTMDSNSVTSSSLSSAPTPGNPDVPAPVTLTAAPISVVACTGSALRWIDASSNETEFRIYRRDSAGPSFIQVGVLPSSDTEGTGGEVTFADAVLEPRTTYTYRVTAFNVADGESSPSNEALLETCDDGVSVVPPARWLDVHLGRRHSAIRDRARIQRDRVVVRGSFQVIDVDGAAIPTVLHDADPRTNGVTIQIRSPSSLVLVTIPAGDPGWTARRRGVFVWRTHNGQDAPVTRVRISTRKSQFMMKSDRIEFDATPVNSITVGLTTQGASGSETRAWFQPETMPEGSNAVFTLPR